MAIPIPVALTVQAVNKLMAKFNPRVLTESTARSCLPKIVIALVREAACCAKFCALKSSYFIDVASMQPSKRACTPAPRSTFGPRCIVCKRGLGDSRAVRPPVRLCSVCLSVTRVYCDKTN